jgi:hypothetical protein
VKVNFAPQPYTDARYNDIYGGKAPFDGIRWFGTGYIGLSVGDRSPNPANFNTELWILCLTLYAGSVR